MAQLWGGRFTKETDKLVYNFNASISFDQKFYKQDIKGSMAHVKMLAKQGILTEEERDQILAGLQGIPGELYEAADMDGATGFQKLFKITIPSIKNTIFITGLLRIIWVANSVDVIFNMTEGGPAYATQTLSVYVFNKAQALNLGYSSAMAILLALVLCLVAVPYLIFTFREEDK